MKPLLEKESAESAAHAPPAPTPALDTTEEPDVSLWQPALARFIEPAWQAIAGQTQTPGGSLRIDHAALAPAVKAQLCRLLLVHAKRTLVLELNVARLLGTLRGDTPEQRFADFIARLGSHPPTWDALLSEYPILSERLHAEQQRYIQNVTEVLTALVRDWDAITATFPGARLCTRLVALSGGMSDGHRGGRSVMRLTFTRRPEPPAARAEPFHLLFKPKELAVDLHFQELIGFCNAAAARGELTLRGLRCAAPAAELGAEFPALYRQRLLPRPTYGWVEYLTVADCPDLPAVRRFYVRQGGFLALLHVLQGTDLHYENIIACGEHPVLVDLETLFHHPFRPSPQGTDAGARARQLLDASVLRTGLLPGRAWGDAARPGVNIGGLGNEDGQLVPQATAGFVDSGTDQMKLAVKHSHMPRARNLPRVGGRIAPATQYGEEIVAGFEAMLRFLCRQSELLLSWDADRNPLLAFANDEVRHIVRATTVYAKLLAAAAHPDCLRSAEQREELLRLLPESDVQVPPQVAAAELAELRAGDVPLFTTRPASRDLWDGQGRCHKDYFATDCLSTVRERLRALAQGTPRALLTPEDSQAAEAELRRQVFLVRAALSACGFGARLEATAASAAAAGSAGDSGTPGSGAVQAQARALAGGPGAMTGWPGPGGAVQERARALAEELGEQLRRSAVHGERDVTWIGMKFTGETACEVAPVDEHLYDGQAGIALFLTYLGAELGERRFVELAHAAARRVHRSVLAAQRPQAARECGGFVGLPSQLYALSHAAAVLGEPGLVRGLSPVVAGLRAAAGREEPLASDVIYGAAGAILALLSLHAVTAEDAVLDAAAQLGRRLVRDAIPTAAGLAWPSHAATRPLLGFAHGTAGIYCALTRLAAVAAAQGGLEPLVHDCAQAAAGALAHERAYFCAAARNWPDLRAESTAAQPARFMRAFCHGAPGVLLSRLVAREAAAAAPLPDKTHAGIAEEIALAVQTTLQSEPAEHGLCHGEAGNLLIVSQAATALDCRAWKDAVTARLGRLVRALRAAGPRCGFAFPAAAPSLMTGLSGVGYGLLALAGEVSAGSSRKLPAVLALAPPRAQGRPL